MSRWAIQPSGRSDASDEQDVALRVGAGALAVASAAGSPGRAIVGRWSSTSETRRSDSRFSPRSWPTNRATNAEAGAARISSGGPNWARTPPVWKTATRSPILIASSMSWVTKRIVLASVSWRRRNSFWRRSRTIGSTAPNGSSMSMIGGSAARARATPTRCRSPPDSWPGSGRGTSPGSRPTRPSSSSDRSRWRAFGQPSRRGTVADVLADRLVREQADLLDDVADAPPQLGQLAGRRRRRRRSGSGRRSAR